MLGRARISRCATRLYPPLVRSMTSSASVDDELLIERDGPVCTIVLNRPKALNALYAIIFSRTANVYRKCGLHGV